MTSPYAGQTESTFGSLDGTGAAGHDVAFHVGRRPSAVAPYPFSTRQYARLVVPRSPFEARLVQGDVDTSAAGAYFQDAAA